MIFLVVFLLVDTDGDLLISTSYTPSPSITVFMWQDGALIEPYNLWNGAACADNQTQLACAASQNGIIIDSWYWPLTNFSTNTFIEGATDLNLIYSNFSYRPNFVSMLVETIDNFGSSIDFLITPLNTIWLNIELECGNASYSDGLYTQKYSGTVTQIGFRYLYNFSLFLTDTEITYKDIFTGSYNFTGSMISSNENTSSGYWQALAR